MFFGLVYIGTALVLLSLSFALRKKTRANVRRQVGEAVRIYLGTTKEPLVFPEERFRRKVLYWLTPGIDTTYFAFVAFQKLCDLYRRRDAGIFLEENADKIEKFLKRHFDRRTGEARHNLEARPTLYGMYCGLTLLKLLRKIPIVEERLGYERAKVFLGKEVVDGMISVVRDCESPGGGYSGSPDIRRPTVVNSDTALGILWNLQQKPANPERVRDFIWSCKRFRDSTFGFANTTADKTPCVCIASYAMRSLLFLEAIRQDVNNFKSVRDDTNQSVISEGDLETLTKFVELSMGSRKGGFAKSPDDTPTLFHTDLVLTFIRSLSKQMDISRLKGRIELSDTVSWIKERETPRGGFGFEPRYLPNVHSTRSAVASLSTLGNLFKNQRKLITGHGVLTYRRHRRFLLSCFDDRVGGFAGYTVANPTA